MNDNSNMDDSAFCRSMDGGMVMYMDGFRFGLSGNQPCLNLFFSHWTLDTVGKFVAAIVGVFLLAMSVEGIAKFRQVIVRHTRAKAWNSALIRSGTTLVHGVQALLGYLLMLATMTYSAELLLATIVGLAAGYGVFFNLNDDLQCSHVASNPCCNFLQLDLIERTKSTVTDDASSAPPCCHVDVLSGNSS